MTLSKNFIEFATTVNWFRNIQFTTVSLKHQIKNDNYNCGVYVCHFFDLLINSNNIDVWNNKLDQNINIDDYRQVIIKKIADNSKFTVCCICHKKEEQKKQKNNNLKHKIMSMLSSDLKVLKCKHTFHLNCIKSEKCVICSF